MHWGCYIWFQISQIRQKKIVITVFNFSLKQLKLLLDITLFFPLYNIFEVHLSSLSKNANLGKYPFFNFMYLLVFYLINNFYILILRCYQKWCDLYTCMLINSKYSNQCIVKQFGININQIIINAYFVI